MRIYTRRGDDGSSGLLSVGNNGRIKKNDLIFEVLGTIDELNSILGKVHTSRNKRVRSEILKIQSELIDMGASVAQRDLYDQKVWHSRLTEMEELIDDLESGLPKITNFIIPGGSALSSDLHLARAVCRRLERRLVEFTNSKKVAPDHLLGYINRLSDLLFVMARYSNNKLGVNDIIWKKEENK